MTFFTIHQVFSGSHPAGMGEIARLQTHGTLPDQPRNDGLHGQRSAVNLNIGTLDGDFIARCREAVKRGNGSTRKPIVLDQDRANKWVSTSLPQTIRMLLSNILPSPNENAIRTETARELMKNMDIIRGNASEILALFGVEGAAFTLGVESMQPVEQAKNLAKDSAARLGCVVVVSGEEDYITDGIRQATLKSGSPMMKRVTGTGCVMTAVIAAFCAVVEDRFVAAHLATAYFGLCGSLAAKKAAAPGSFRTAFIDELFLADFGAMKEIVPS
ncbi:putative Hydroxyethylthiazole kinase [Hypsibius exemplaris]|uniref:hydroxyethylthiazole kinase n=1 Tax=Hypsibius exemplaris TaxID=2072580 RepID=A0A9X6NBQ0_HYPEX|nr:putative Hydroxyethylthiazole kinase [Hypsibius exemplaris]